MIQSIINAEPYCTSCRLFSPGTETVKDFDSDTGERCTKVFIFCKYREHCSNLYKNLKRMDEKENLK